jgi:hypothetical protein
MNIGVELSIKFSEHNYHSDIIKTIKSNAEFLGCSTFYYDYEIGGKTTTNYTKRNHYVITVLFDKESPINIVQFIKYIDLMHKIYLECVYENDVPYNIIFCSSYYRENCLNKDCVNYSTIKKTTTRKHLDVWLKKCLEEN